MEPGDAEDPPEPPHIPLRVPLADKVSQLLGGDLPVLHVVVEHVEAVVLLALAGDQIPPSAPWDGATTGAAVHNRKHRLGRKHAEEGGLGSPPLLRVLSWVLPARPPPSRLCVQVLVAPHGETEAEGSG